MVVAAQSKDSHPNIKIIDFGLSNYVEILQKSSD